MYGGLRGRNMRLWLDHQKLAAYGLDATDVSKALRNEHLERPAGYLQGDWMDLNVRTMGEAKTVKEFEDIPVLVRDLQVVRIKQLRREGHSLIDAVLLACPTRLRPILMTTLATIAGAVPLSLGIGAGAETRAPLARSIIGGCVLSTLVTLIIVPLFYVLFDRFGTLMTTLAKREKGEEVAASRESPPLSLNGTNGQHVIDGAPLASEANEANRDSSKDGGALAL
jgi:multidrug efflux pump subunit AcrB